MSGSTLSTTPTSHNTDLQPGLRRHSAWIWGGLYFVVGLALVFYNQAASGIGHAEFGHFPDEPAHAMTSVFFRDFLAGGFPSPVAFAKLYYLHYPKIAIGIWPPVFYVLAGFWLLIFGTSHTSFLVFMATGGAALSTTLSLFVRRICGPWLGLASGAVFLCLAPVRYGTATLMVDVPMTLMILLAAVSLVRYIRTERTRDALLFGLLTGLAMLTKGNALSLLLFAGLMVLVTGKFRLLLKKDLYLAGAVVALIGIPWQILSFRLLAKASLIESTGAPRLSTKASGYLLILWEQLGLVFVLGFGFFMLRLFWKRMSLPPEIAAAGCLVSAVYLFHVFTPVPGPDGRYMMAALGPLIALFLAGASSLTQVARGVRVWGVYAAVALIFAFGLPAGAWRIPRHDRLGMGDAARLVHDSRDKVVLINAASPAEGAFVLEMALLDHRPEHIIVRASKVLSDNPWSPTQYRPLHTSPDALRARLTQLHIDSVVVDLTESLWEQDRTRLLTALRGDPAHWQLAHDLNSPPNTHHLLIFTRIRPANEPPVSAAQVRDDLAYLLDRYEIPWHLWSPAP